MPLSVTYTFSNSTTADATQVNQNFTDILNILGDGTKNLSISAFTAAGVTNLQGAVTLGASTSNLLVINCALNSDLPVNTNTTYNIGAANKGLLSVYLGGTSTFTGRLVGPTLSGSVTYTFPTSTCNIVGDTATQTVSNKTLLTTVTAVKVANYNVAASDDEVLGDSSGGTFTFTLPTAVGAGGKVYTLKKVDSSTTIISVATTSAQTIDGLASTQLGTTRESLQIVSDNANWRVIHRNHPRNWTTFTMSITGSVSNPTKASSPTQDKAFYRRVGDTLEIRYYYQGTATGAASGSGTYQFNIPNSWTIDTAKVASTASALEVLGSFVGVCGGGGNLVGAVVYASTTYVQVLFLGGTAYSAPAVMTAATYPLATTSTYINMDFRVPISNWGE